MPVGMSMATCVAPMAFFLLRIEGKSIGSIPKGVLNLDEEVVGWRKLQNCRPKPGTHLVLATVCLNFFNRQRHGAKCFHPVRGARWRGDCPRRSFRNRESCRRHNGHNEHAGFVAWYAADAVFVKDGALQNQGFFQWQPSHVDSASFSAVLNP